MKFFENDCNCLLPELFCVFTSVALMMYGAAYGKSTSGPSVGPKPGLLSTGGVGLLILFYVGGLLVNQPISLGISCASGFVLDSLSSQCKLIMVGAAFFSIFLSMNYMREQALNGFENVCLMLFSIIGGMFLISSADLMALFLSIEIQSMCFYVLAASARNSEFSTEAGLKYLVLGAFSSGVLLFGCSLLYGFCGTTSVYELASLTAIPWAQNGNGTHVGVGLVFILFGVLFKLGAAPFHSWVPDVYDGAPIGITTFFAAVPKVAIMAFLLRVSTQLSQMWPQMLTTILEGLEGLEGLTTPVNVAQSGGNKKRYCLEGIFYFKVFLSDFYLGEQPTFIMHNSYPAENRVKAVHSVG